MALDATIAGASANSYLTLADADAIDSDLGIGEESTRWRASGTTTEERELMLRRATSMIDARVPTASRFSTTQLLAFPRAGDKDAAGDPILPARVRNATYYQAAYLLTHQGVLSRSEGRRARNAKRASETGTSYEQADDPTALYSRYALQELAIYGSTDAGDGMVVVNADTGIDDPYSTGVTL